MNTKSPILQEILEKVKQRNEELEIAKSQTPEEILIEMQDDTQ